MSEVAAHPVDTVRIEFMANSVIHTANSVKGDTAKAEFIGVVPLLALQLCDAGRQLLYALLEVAMTDPVSPLNDEGRSAMQRVLAITAAAQ